MDFEEEKLSVSTILFIIGISLLVFTGVMRFLDGETHTFFLKAGIGCLAGGILLVFLKQLILHLAQTGKKTRKAP